MACPAIVVEARDPIQSQYAIPYAGALKGWVGAQTLGLRFYRSIFFTFDPSSDKSPIKPFSENTNP
jgi:hypothetical protein